MTDGIKKAEPQSVSLPEPDIGDRIKRVRGLTDDEKRTLGRMEHDYFRPGGFWHTALGRTLCGRNQAGKIVRTIARIGSFFIPLSPQLKEEMSLFINEIIQQPKQTHMSQSNSILGRIKARLSEPSTYKGLVTVAGVVGITLNPGLWQAIGAVAVGIIGLIQVIENESAKKK